MNKKLLLTVPFVALALDSSAKTDKTNIIIINLDDAGYGDFSCTGASGYSTPNIDKMASEGLRFTQFLAVQPVSGASRMGLLTGCYPNRLGFYGAPGPGDNKGISPSETTLAELVRQEGYATAIFGKWHLGDRHEYLPLQNGFDEYYGLPYSNDMWPYHPTRRYYGDLPTMKGNDVVGYNTDQSKFTQDYTRYSVEFIKKNRKNPFFLYLAHSMPHVPLAVSDMFKGKSEDGLFGDVMMEIDWSVGEILKTLKQLKLEENTLVVLTSDNGPWINYGNHAGSPAGMRQGKGTTFEGGNRVPCIMYWKGRILPGGISNSLASNIDIFPTVAEIVGAELPENKIDGVSLMPILDGDLSAKPRKHFAYYYRKNDLEAVTDGRYKLIFPHVFVDSSVYPAGRDGQPGKQVNTKLTEPELYDLRKDKGERYNIYNYSSEIVSELMKIADYYREELGDDITGSKGKNRRMPISE